MLKNSFKYTKYLLFVLVVFSLSFILYSAYSSYYYNRSPIPLGIPPRDKSLTQDIYENFSFKAFRDFQSKFKLMSPNADWSSWSWKDDMFMAQVTEVNKLDGTLTLVFLGPKTTALSNNIVVELSCPLKESILLDDQLFPKQIGLLVFDHIELDSILYSFCLNETCTKIGKSCIIRNF
ncbi:hypothetical protein HYV31_01300 [candidate division WWE3 bacterium]|nr:hypothetical protein [candidate division WWE3 bacterium]